MKRVERVRLYPTVRQRQRLQFALDVTRQLYNALLEQRREAYRRRGVVIRSKDQYAELTALRSEDARIAAVYRECEDAVLYRLDLAFAAFIRRMKLGDEKPGYPRFKPAARWTQLEYPHGDRALKFNGEQSSVRVPGMGSIRVRKGRLVPAFGRAWLVRKNERWYACFECERAMKPLPQSDVILGIDRGVHVLAATSAGALISNPAFGERNSRRIAQHQRALEAYTVRDAARRVRNAGDARRRAAKLLDAGFGQFERLIIEKAEEAARLVVRVDARFSSQECSRCGHTAREGRRRRRFCCVRCGFQTHADVNAALVIRRRVQLALLSMPDAGAEPVTQHDAAQGVPNECILAT